MPNAPAFCDVLAERERQDAKWGEQNHDLPVWLVILMEEVGEMSEAYLEAQFGKGDATDIRDEAVHAAAVALAIVECIDRNIEVDE